MVELADLDHPPEDTFSLGCPRSGTKAGRRRWDLLERCREKKIAILGAKRIPDKIAIYIAYGWEGSRNYIKHLISATLPPIVGSFYQGFLRKMFIAQFSSIGPPSYTPPKYQRVHNSLLGDDLRPSVRPHLNSYGYKGAAKQGKGVTYTKVTPFYLHLYRLYPFSLKAFITAAAVLSSTSRKCCGSWMSLR